MPRLSVSRRWCPAIPPASAPSPPRAPPSASGCFTVPCIVAPQIAPDTTRDASGVQPTGGKGSLSAINSLIASSAILFEALAKIILANGESPVRIHLRFRAQATTASAVIGRKPATAPADLNDHARRLAEQALRLSRTWAMKKMKFRYSITWGSAFYFRGMYSEALTNYQLATDAFRGYAGQSFYGELEINSGRQGTVMQPLSGPPRQPRRKKACYAFLSEDV